MLRRGQVYKITYTPRGLPRNYMIMSPNEDLTASFLRLGRNIIPIFHVNFVGDLNHNQYMGTFGIVKIEKPNTEQDFKDIEAAMKCFHMKYNKKFNRVEYDI